jgi:hypothetical protein
MPSTPANNTYTVYAPVICSERSKVLLHFFPNLGVLSTPSPVGCRLRLFGKGRVSLPLAIDGLRLSQPDTVPLTALFADFGRDYGHLAGISIELSGVRGIHHSQVFIEIRSPLASTRFLAQASNEDCEALPGEERLLPMAFEASQMQKVILLNPRAESICLKPGASPLSEVPSTGPAQEIAPYSLLEIACQPAMLDASDANAGTSVGSLPPGAIAGVKISSAAPVSYLFTCDRSTHLPLHVSAL